MIVLRKLGWVGKYFPSDPASWAEIQRSAPTFFILALVFGAMVFAYSDPE